MKKWDTICCVLQAKEQWKKKCFIRLVSKTTDIDTDILKLYSSIRTKESTRTLGVKG